MDTIDKRKHEIQEFLRNHIRSSGKTQVELGEIMGISQSEVSAIQRGNFYRCSLARLLKFCTALGFDVIIVVSDKEDQEK